MTFHVDRRHGGSISSPSAEEIDEVLAKLDGPEDDEHPDVALTHESEWCLSAFPGGLLVWENVEEGDEPRHMRDIPRHEVRRLWHALAAGDIETVDAEPWLPGYG